MTYNSYVRADSIYKKIDNLRKLRRIADRPYKRFRLSKTFLWISDYTEDNVVLCDEGLAKLIEEYCDKQIAELKKELESL